eukprot:SAG31_NODE_31440_length_368_cov_0.773234_1_plen_75_part_01
MAARPAPIPPRGEPAPARRLLGEAAFALPAEPRFAAEEAAAAAFFIAAADMPAGPAGYAAAGAGAQDGPLQCIEP